MIKAEIIAVGAELTSGQCLDTNSAWLANRLDDLGIDVRFHTTIADDLADNVAAFRLASERVELVLVSGGLGPTQDDLTREALARAAGVELVRDPRAEADLIAFFARRNRPIPERNFVQTFIPNGGEILSNPIGTAPGIWFRLGRARFACMPGVPNELKMMFIEQVVPHIKGLTGDSARVVVRRKINTFGKGESEIEADALDLTARGRVPEVGITASEATISFRIAASGSTEAEAREALQPTVDLIYRRFGDWIIGEDDEDVQHALARELIDRGATIALAESCTGGLISHMLTSLAGSSAYFPGGVVSYSNEAKVDLLGVPRETIETKGAVSDETARAMAIGVRDRFHADLGLSVTGVAGPSGGTVEKPIGLVYLGLAHARGVESRRLELGPEQPRSTIQRRAAKHAINWARLYLRT
jgi:nicotinamide-nucleotide amidase